MQIELPHNADSERAILGAILHDSLLCEQARREVPLEWFYTQSYKKIFGAMLALHERKEAIDSIVLTDELRRIDPEPAWISILADVVYGLPRISNLKPYISRVKEAARRRWLMKFAEKLTQQAQDESEEQDAVLANAVEQIQRVRNFKSEKRKPETLGDSAEDQLLRYDLYFKGVSDALPTGFHDIDSRLLGGGLVPSGLYVLAATTSIGKTSLALDISANIAETGHRVYVVSREMSKESLFDRLVAVEADVARWKLRPGIFEKEYKQVQSAVVRLANRPIILDDVSANAVDISGYLREYERKDERVELVIVDYLQLLEGTRKETRNQEVGSISRALKGLAMEFRVPVIAISQLKRIGGREPELDDLRDSGEIEQDADAVFFLFGEKPEEGAKFYERTFKCGKHREGPLFTCQMPFNGELVTYRRPRVETEGAYDAAH